MSEPTNGIELIAAERQRQVDSEDRTLEHDLSHRDNELAWAAACYAAPKTIYAKTETGSSVHFTEPWPMEWVANFNRGEPGWAPWRRQIPDDRIRELTKAGALIAAEIDRLLGSAS